MNKKQTKEEANKKKIEIGMRKKNNMQKEGGDRRNKHMK